MPEHIREKAILMNKAGIKTSHIWKLTSEVHGGCENVGCIKSDMYRGIGRKYSSWDDSDTSTTMCYLESKKGPDDKFFYKYALDDQNRLTNLFWSDGFSQVDYELFGDCLAFDATYKSNTYGKPLVILLGSNNHDKTCVFGAALLQDENWETYVWVLETFLECMDGKKPDTVLTDGCKSMNKALKAVMPKAPHLICCWHIIKNAGFHIRKTGFLDDLRKLIFRYYAEDEWEKNWKEMVGNYDLASNAWINAQHTTGKQWADTFLRGIYFGGARATGRCESMNALLKKDLQDKIPLWMFMRHFDGCLTDLRYNEMKEHYKTNMTEALPNQTSMPCVEEEISAIFTREIYFRIKREINRGDNYIMNKDNDNIEGYTVCSIMRYGGTGLARTVQISNDQNHEDVKFVGQKMLNSLLRRKVPHPGSVENSRYAGITVQIDITSYLASRSPQAFEMAMKVISQLNAELDQINPDKDFGNLKYADGTFPGTVSDSAVCITKGRPTVASKSKSNPSGSNKRKRNCKFCHETGHDIRKCPAKKRDVDEDGCNNN